ncbi:MAG: DUF6265 family protein [Planctomycetota bacterium]
MQSVAAQASAPTAEQAARQTAGQTASESEIAALCETWLCARDITPDRAPADRSPSYGSVFTIRREADALFLDRPKSTTRPHLRVPLDGSEAKTVEGNATTTVRGQFHAGAWQVDLRVERSAAEKTSVSVFQWTFKPVSNGMEVKLVLSEPVSMETLCLYQTSEQIEVRPPVTAQIGALAWVAGHWSGKLRTSTVEERWCEPAGGAMLAISRTVKGEKMVAFEFLRIAEQGGTLVYFAQPGGRTATEFTLVELSDSRAVFENPHHDFPQRITYERTGEQLTAEISHVDGGAPQRFEFTRAP